MKKIIAVLFSLVFLFGAVACSNKADGKDGDAYVLTIYRSRDQGMTDGDRDEAVKTAIEEKFYADTGIKIKLDLNLYTNEQINNIVDVNFNNKNKNIDAFIHYMSEDDGSAIIKYAKDASATINLDPVLQQYGQNILANINKNDEGHLADRAGYFKSNGEYQRKVLTSFSNEGGYGILIRKDLMKQVQSITGLDPEDYDVTNGSYKNMTLSQFESVMKAIKDNTSVTTPVNGKPWDIGRVFGTTFGIDALSGYGFDENGNYVPAQFSVNFDKYVDLMYRWARDGIWETESNTTTDDQRLTNFVAGKCACYVAYPKAELLINVAKRFYAANTGNEEIMVIAPLASEDAKGNVLEKDGKPVVNGNLKTNRGYYGMIVPYRSKNYEILVKYLDWMYSSVDNYELCQYGVKGVDWIEGEDFVYNDTTYKTWAYPEGKESEYLSKSPYSGKYVLVPNINLSNRICSHYNTTYKTWYTSCYFEFPQFKLDNIEGIWISEPTRDIALQAADIDGDYVDTIRSYAWVGQKLDGKTPAETLAAYLIEKRSKDADFLAFTNNEYKAALEFFNAKYAQ